MARLLLIEDDLTIRTPLVRALRERGHAVAAASTAMTGLRDALDDRPDLVVLDLGLPDLDGREALRMLRAVSTVPVIVATARDDETEIVTGAGCRGGRLRGQAVHRRPADARVRAVLRRGPGGPGDRIPHW